MSNILEKRISDSVELIKINDDKFKSNLISLAFITPLDETNSVINNFVANILINGSSFKELNRKLENLYSASLNCVNSKIGDKQLIEIHVSSIKDEYALNKEKISIECAKLLKELIFSPTLKDGLFLESYVEKERKQLLENIMSTFADKRSYALKKMDSVLFEGEKFGIDIEGSAEQINSITNSQLVQGLKNMLAQSYMKIVVVGTGDIDEIFNIFSGELENLKKSLIKFSTPSPSKVKSEVKNVTQRFEVNQAKLVMGYKTNIILPDKKAVAMELAIAVLGGTPNSKLFVNVREKLSLCYYCASRYDKSNGSVIIDSGVESKNVELTKQEVTKQIEEMKCGNITDEEIAIAKLSRINFLKSFYDSYYLIYRWYINQISGAKLISPEDRINEIQAVTKQDVIDCINTIKLDSVYTIEPLEDK